MTIDRGPWMSTFTGKRFYFLHPRPEDVCVEDIAHSLARIARFGGHTKGRPYSVAEHAVNVAERLYREKCSASVIYAGLHHDAHEAYLGDVIRPLKLARTHIDRYLLKGFESEVERVVQIALDIQTDTIDWRPIETADLRMMMTEARALMTEQGAGWSVTAEPYDMQIRPLGFDQAEGAYLYWHSQLLTQIRAEARDG